MSAALERKEGSSFEGDAFSSIGTLSSKYGIQYFYLYIRVK